VEGVVVWHILSDALVVLASNVGVVNEHGCERAKRVLIPLDGKCSVLPVVEFNRQARVEVCFWSIGVVVFKFVLTDAEADVSLGVVWIISAAAREESSVSVWFNPE